MTSGIVYRPTPTKLPPSGNVHSQLRPARGKFDHQRPTVKHGVRQDGSITYLSYKDLAGKVKKLGSRDKVGSRNDICEVARCEPLANQGVRSAAADYILPFNAKPQREECNVVNALDSLRNFVPRP